MINPLPPPQSLAKLTSINPLPSSQIKDSKAHANNLITLLSVCPPPSATGDGKLAGAAILALCRSFSHLLSEGDVVVPGMAQAERAKVKGPEGGAREK